MLGRHSFGGLVVLWVAMPSLSIAGTPRPNSSARGAALPVGAVMVGVAQIDIAPEFRVRLAGYAGRMDEAGEVMARFAGKTPAIGGDDGDGPVVLIMVENCSATVGVNSSAARLMSPPKKGPSDEPTAEDSS